MSHQTIAGRRVEVHRLGVSIQGDPRRTIMRFFWPGADRARRVAQQVMSLPVDQVRREVDEVFALFEAQHADLESLLMQNAQETAARLQTDLGGDPLRQLLVGACMSMEYSIEAAALFNPSMVLAPDQTGLPPGQARFLMSMRAVGEGHLSSIVFRRGIITSDGQLELSPPARRARQVRQVPNPEYRKAGLERKLRELNKLYQGTRLVLDALDDVFTYQQLLEVLERLRSEQAVPGMEAVHRLLVWLVKSNYQAQVSEDLPISEVVLFPAGEAESHGMEDMRLVRFQDDGQVMLCGTYTAFNGNKILPQMMVHRPGAKQVQVVMLLGQYAQGKGLALFPRKVNGRYMMLGRCDGQSNYLLSSNHLDFWDEGTLLNGP